METMLIQTPSRLEFKGEAEGLYTLFSLFH